MSGVDLVFCEDGDIRAVYSDQLAPALLAAIGQASIARVSHVEPTVDNRWTADLSPVGGPVLGSFALRADALAAEHDWLADRLHSIVS